MTNKQSDMLISLLIALAGASGWGFLLFNLYFDLALPLGA